MTKPSKKSDKLQQLQPIINFDKATSFHYVILNVQTDNLQYFILF